MSESSSRSPFSLSLLPPFLHPSIFTRRVFVGERHKSVPQLYQRPQKEIISDRFYRDGFSASHASGIKAAMQVSLYDPLSSSILMPLRSGRIKLATIFLSARLRMTAEATLCFLEMLRASHCAMSFDVEYVFLCSETLRELDDVASWVFVETYDLSNRLQLNLNMTNLISNGFIYLFHYFLYFNVNLKK